MIRLSICELLANGSCSWHGDGWHRIHHRAVGDSVLMADRRGVNAILQCVPGVTGLWLLRHGWSGIATISSGGETQRVSLRADNEDLQFILPLDVPADEPSEIRITVDCDAQTPASHAQVWVLGLTFDKLPVPKAKAQTLSSTARLIEGDWGRFLVLPTDADIPLGILNHGAWAPHDIEVFKEHIREGDCVLDIGTHVGHHSIVFSKLVGPSGFVLSVEAQRVMFQLLNANCVINAAFNVQPIHMAASDHDHTVNMYPISYSGDNNFGALGVNVEPNSFSQGNRGEAVPAGCIDDVVERYCIGRPVAFVKIDVQSYEKFALRGLLRTITRDRPKIFFEVSPYWMGRAGYDYREIYYLLTALDYRFEYFRPLPMTPEGIPDVSAGQNIEWDTLAVPSKKTLGAEPNQPSVQPFGPAAVFGKGA